MTATCSMKIRVGVAVMMSIGILLFSNTCLIGQELELGGYFEPQLMGAKIKNEFYQLSSNKLRVDLQYKPSDRVAFGANFDYITYHGKTQWNVLDFLPASVISEATPTNFFGMELNPYILPFENRQFLDNAFLKLSFKYADVTVGKQQLSMGTGYAWNPTDVFNKKDIIDPTYEQPGHNALRIDVPLTAGFGVTAIYAPTEGWDYNDVLLKLKGRLSHFDFSILGIRKRWNFTDARAFDPVQMNFLQLRTKRYILGGDVVGELLGLGVWAEYAHNDVKIADLDMETYVDLLSGLQPPHSSYQPPAMNIPDSYYEFVVGFDYTFDFQTYIMCEYYRNTAAKSDYKKYNLNDWMQLLVAETKAISHDQIYCFLQHPATDLINVGSSAIFSISDHSVAVVPMLTFNVYENVDLSVFLNFYLGKEGTAYAGNLGNGGIIRARVYF